jgi:23S rRNA (cytidine1920-2'-O)/16S rRNA (cytidine1409-2'-O)-methyltransferase
VGSSRLDAVLVARGLAPSRSRATDAIKRGTVRVHGKRVTKPGTLVPENAEIEISDPAADYVSRAALKLIHALDVFDFSPEGRVCLDLGASTGGFTQVLLERGAHRVHALDVGHDQMHALLRGDPRLVLHEGVNARALSPELIGEPVEAMTADVSFISLRLALPPALAIAAPGAWAVLLVKPQFELGPEAIGKGGIVRDAAMAEAAAKDVAAWLEGRGGWRVAGLVASPILGGDGNREFLLAARRVP